MPERSLVEAVAGQLEAMEAEVEQEVALQQASGFVGDAAAPEVWMHRQHFELRDPVRLADLVVAHRAGAGAVDLDDEAPEAGGLALRALDLDRTAATSLARPPPRNGSTSSSP